MSKARNRRPPTPCWASPIAFSIGPALFALLKAVALWIYPLDQKRVDDIERELAVRRLANPQTSPA
jgi:Na+/melibiose symporter-like transporter